MQYDAVDRYIEMALREDLGEPGDVTTNAVVGEMVSADAVVLCKSGGLVAGLDLSFRVFSVLAGILGVGVPEIVESISDGAEVKKGAVAMRIRGNARLVLGGERTFLNILQRMSAIATLTSKLVRAVSETKAVIVDTRKTTPNFRIFEKTAVRLGGGRNHRFGLYDGILIKDNHIAAAGGIKKAVSRARRAAHHLMKIEVETGTMSEVREALAAGADVIMLDNMTPDQMREAVKIIDGRALVEASGGITEKTVLKVARTGVDFISAGALTHSAGILDISLDISCQGAWNE